MRVIKYHPSFQQILHHLAKQDPEEKLRIAFNLWQFAKDLQGKNSKEYYEKRTLNTTRTVA